jgi:hypothetical protein
VHYNCVHVKEYDDPKDYDHRRTRRAVSAASEAAEGLKKALNELTP